MTSKQPRLTAAECEKLLFKNGFSFIRSSGSHRIYMKGNIRIVIPFHSKKILHPKIIRQVLEAIGQD